MNLVPQYLAVFYLPPGKRKKKTYNPHITTVARTITNEAHQKCIKKSKKAKLEKKKKRKREKELGIRNRRKVTSRKEPENKKTARKKERMPRSH